MLDTDIILLTVRVLKRLVRLPYQCNSRKPPPATKPFLAKALPHQQQQSHAVGAESFPPVTQLNGNTKDKNSDISQMLNWIWTVKYFTASHC